MPDVEDGVIDDDDDAIMMIVLVLRMMILMMVMRFEMMFLVMFYIGVNDDNVEKMRFFVGEYYADCDVIGDVDSFDEIAQRVRIMMKLCRR